MKDTWMLTDGFLCEEGRAVLLHLAKIRYSTKYIIMSLKKMFKKDFYLSYYCVLLASMI